MACKLTSKQAARVRPVPTRTSIYSYEFGTGAFFLMQDAVTSQVSYFGTREAIGGLLPSPLRI